MVGGSGGGGCGLGWSGMVGVDQNPWEIIENQIYSIRNWYFGEIWNQGFQPQNIDFHHFLIHSWAKKARWRETASRCDRPYRASYFIYGS